MPKKTSLSQTIFICLFADSTDIVDCKLKLILGLIWTLILHYSISMPIWDGEGDNDQNHADNKGPTPKQRYLIEQPIRTDIYIVTLLTRRIYLFSDYWTGFNVKYQIFQLPTSPTTGTTAKLSALWSTQSHQVLNIFPFNPPYTTETETHLPNELIL